MERSFTQEKARAPKPQETPEQKAARLEVKTLAYFERFFEEAFEIFVKDRYYNLPSDRELRWLFEQDDTSPIGESVHWLTVTNSCLRSFTAFCRKHAITDPKNILAFTERVTEDWMRETPNILSKTSFEVLPQRALLHQEPSISDSLREKLIGESTYDLRLAGQEGSRLFDHLMNTASSSEELLALIAYFTRIHRAAEQMDWSEDGATTIEHLLTAWKNKPDRSILLQQAAESALETIRGNRDTNTYPVPSVFITRHKDDQPTSSPKQIGRDTGALLNAWGTPSEVFLLPKQGPHVAPAVIDALHSLQEATHHEPRTFGGYILLLKHIATVSPLIKDIPHPKGVPSLIKIAGEIALLQAKPHPQEQDRERFAYLVERFERETHSVLSELPGYRLPKTYLDTLFSTARKKTGVPECVAEPLPNHLPGTIEQKLETASLLRTLHTPTVYQNLEKQFGFSLIELSLREQVRLGQWLVNVNEERSKDSIDIIRTYGVHAAQTFLACEHDASHGDRLLAFAKLAPQDVARKTFATFANIADMIDLSSQELAKGFFREGTEQQVDAERVRQELIKRGANILLDAEALIAKDPSGEQLLGRLERYKADTVLFLSLFTATLKGKRESTNLESLRDLEVGTCTMQELPEEDRLTMKELLNQQWSKKPLEYLFPDEGTFSFFLLRRKSKIIGFIRFETQTDGKHHANFLCVDESLRGSGIGEQLFKEAIDRAAKAAPVHAEFDASIPAGSMYIERFGFVGTGTVEEERPEGVVEWVTLERNGALLDRLASRHKTVTPEQIHAWAKHGDAPKPLRVVSLTGPSSTMEVGMIAALHAAKREHSEYVLSRYLLRTLPNGQEERVLVFDIPTSPQVTHFPSRSSRHATLAQAYSSPAS